MPFVPQAETTGAARPRAEEQIGNLLEARSEQACKPNDLPFVHLEGDIPDDLSREIRNRDGNAPRRFVSRDGRFEPAPGHELCERIRLEPCRPPRGHDASIA